MKLEGSCHCRSVTFTVDSAHPVPFNLCYCSICRKTAGAGGYAINLGARAATMTVEGREHISTYQSSAACERTLCSRCGSALWVFSPEWPDLIHPHASAIDSDLPMPPERTHLMLGSKAGWVEPEVGPRDKTFEEYPDESIADWHKRTGMTR